MKLFTSTILILFAVLFNTDNAQAKKNMEVSFTSEISSLTKIQLNLYTNDKFTLIINIFGDNIRATKSKGRWYTQDGYYILTFKKRSSPSLKALFPNHPTSNINVLTDESFKFKNNVIELLIYGVKCKRGSFGLG